MKYINLGKKYIFGIWQKGFFHVFLGQFVTKFIAFFGSIFIVRLLTKQEYGILGYYENLYSYAFIFAGLGLSNAIIRYVVLGKEKNKQYSYYRYAVMRAVIIDMIIAAALVVFNIFYPHPSEYASYSTLLIICACTLPFQDMFTEALCNERAMFANNRYAYFSVAVSGSIILGRVLGALFFDVYGVLIIQLCIYLIWGLVLIFLEKKKYYTGIEYVKPEISEKKEVNKYAIQYMITNGLWAIFMLNDVFMLGRFNISATALAEYKVAYVFPANMSIFSTAIGIVVGPYFIKHEEDNSWIRRNFKKVFLITFAGIAIVAIIIALLAQPIVLLLYGEEYLNIIGLMRFMLISAFLNAGVRYTFANILASMGKIKYNMYIAIIGVALQIILNLIFIPLWGTWGTVVTNIIVQFIMSAYLAIVFYRLYYRKAAVLS